MYFKLHIFLAVIILLVPVNGAAVVIGPLNPSGSIGFVTQYNKSAFGTTSSSRSYVLRGGVDSYVWQPWFISWSGSLGLTSSVQGSSGAISRNITGSLALDLLPRSRFPLSLGYFVANSLTEYKINSDATGGISSEREIRTEGFTAYQTYTAWGGTHYAGWYTSNDYDAPAVQAGEERLWGRNSSSGLSVSRRFELHSLEMMLSGNESSSSGSSASSETASISHNYSPENEFGVSSGLLVKRRATYSSNQRNTSGSDVTVNSRFFWRPDYSDFSVNGSINASEAAAGVGSNRSISAQMSGGYRLSRSIRVSAGISVNLNENEGESVRSGSSSQNIGLSYSSDRHLIGKFTWGWNTGFGLSNSVSRGGSSSQSQSSMNLSLGHSASRQIALSEKSLIGFSMSQSGGASKTISGSGGSAVDDSAVQGNINHSISANYRHSGDDGTTSIWSSLSDNRDFSSGSTQQGFQVNFSRDERMSRTSGLTGTVVYSYSQSDDPDAGRSSRSNSGGSMSYRDSRFLGVHRLRLQSDLKLSEVGAQDAGLSLISTLSNRVSYQLGLLSVMLSASYSHRTDYSGLDQRYMFSVTRTF